MGGQIFIYHLKLGRVGGSDFRIEFLTTSKALGYEVHLPI
jgi:hypothetical protein